MLNRPKKTKTVSHEILVENYRNYIDSRDLEKAMRLKDKKFINIDKVERDI